MTDRDRLIEILQNRTKDPCHLNGLYEWADDIADHLIANGIICLPCKVGDTVYSYKHSWCIEDGIAPYQITNIIITQNEKCEWTEKYRALRVINGKTINWQLNFASDEIGKTVFPTPEEAEKALERSKGQ